MVRLFLSIYEAFLAHRKLVTAFLLVLIAGAVAMALRMGYEEDIARFLPKNEQNERYTDVYQNLAGQGRIVVVFNGEDTDSIENAMDCFEEHFSSIDSTQTIKDLQVRLDETQMLDMMSFVYQHAALFMTEDDWSHVDSLLQTQDYVARQLEENKQMLLLPTAGAMVETMRYDPLHLFTPILQRLQSFKMSDEFVVLNGCVFTKDEKTALAFMTSPYGVSESMHNNRLKDMIDEAILQTNADVPSVGISAVGTSLIAVGNANQIRQDSFLAVGIAVVLILLLLILHYRRMADLWWIGASIAFGWLFAIAGMSVFADTVSVIVLGIGSVIIGIAVNYPLHYLDHLKETRNEKQTLRDMVPPLLIGNITTVSAFFCLVWLDATAMRDLGLFGSLMLIGTILFVLVFMPLYVKASKAVGEKHLDLNLDILKLNTRRQRRWFILMVTVLTVVLGWYSFDTSFDSDIKHINYMSEEQQKGLDVLSKASDDASVFAVSEGSDLELALQRNETIVLPKLRELQQEGTVSRVSGVGAFLPSMQAQQSLADHWNAYWSEHRDKLLVDLRRESARQGFAFDAFEPFVQQITVPVEPLSVEHFGLIKSFLSDSYIQKGDDGLVRVVNYLQTTDEERVKNVIGQDLKSPTFVFSTKDISSQLVEILSDSFNYIGFVCGFVVFFFLWISFGRLELSLLSFLPLAVSWLWILGAMQVLGVQFNIVNIILATFIFGQGDDYTIFITEGLITEYATGRKRLESYKRSVALSAVIMFIGIGSLILAKHPALRSLAEVTVIGMFTVVLMAFYLPPLVFRWITRTSNGQLRQVPLTLKRIGNSLFAILFFVFVIYLFMLPFTWIYFHIGKATEKRKLRYHAVLRRMADFVIHHVPGVKFHLENRYHETFEQPAVVVCNHQSHLDLMCLMMLTPKIIFLTNDWVWHNPFYGAVIHRAEFYPVSDGIENHVEKLRDLYLRGYSIAVFPEGTRSEDCTIMRFHQGAFYLAEQLGADILPIFLHGVGHVLPKRDFMLREGSIHVEVEKRISLDNPHFAGTLLERTKLFRHYFVEHYQDMQKRIETPSYFVPYIRYQYMYKGMDVEKRSRQLLAKAMNEYANEDYSSQTAIELKDEGQGEKALLVALTHPYSEVRAELSDEEGYLIASNLAGKPKNLHLKQV